MLRPHCIVINPLSLLICRTVSGSAIAASVAAASSSVGETLRPKPRSYIDASHGTQRPYFDDVSPRNVTAIVGQSAILNCRVKHLGDRTVSKTVFTVCDL
ncbi:hypothetical protein C0J52_19535 [Blattella germanica]|nr:hypothetical protein C0J52_19535 [Blattella germanica]